MRRFWILVGLVLLLSACGSAEEGGLFPSTIPVPLGGEAELDSLRSGCAAGDYARCDVLNIASDLGSELEAFGNTCGERADPPLIGGYCAIEFNVSIDFDQLRSMCGDDDMVACDMLFLYSDNGSADEAYGGSCGNRVSTGLACVLQYGFSSGF